MAGAASFVASCRNFDGGFGATPGGESHAGQVFTAVGARRRILSHSTRALPAQRLQRYASPGAGALAIAGALHEVDADLLGWWLAERQVVIPPPPLLSRSRPTA